MASPIGLGDFLFQGASGVIFEVRSHGCVGGPATARRSSGGARWNGAENPLSPASCRRGSLTRLAQRHQPPLVAARRRQGCQGLEALELMPPPHRSR